jgi:hypothetical protein
MSKYDIRALKVGLKVTPELRNALIILVEFNKNFIGENSVFPVKNGAPRLLEQFKDNPYTLELLDQYTTGSKHKRSPLAKAAYYQGKPATRGGGRGRRREKRNGNGQPTIFAEQTNKKGRSLLKTFKSGQSG